MAFLHYNANTNSVILRNVGQSLGLGAMITNDKLDSTVNINNLSRLENLTHKTTYPQWKVAFGDIPELAINTESANRGKVIYEKQCQICHDSQDFVGPRKNLRNYQVTSLEHLGTDPFAAQNAVKPIHGQSRLIPFQDKILSDVSGVKRRFYERYQIDEEQQSTNEFFAIRGGEFFRDTLVGFKQNDPAIGYGDIEAGSGYKARHLSSVWATGPFLHNGSVPTLWELLLPAKHRPKTFRVRSREFDAERVGISTVRDCDTKEPDCFNTAGSDSDGSPIAGNTNVGHEFGAIDTKYGKALLDQEKKDLIEYLKVLPPNDEYSWQDSSY